MHLFQPQSSSSSIEDAHSTPTKCVKCDRSSTYATAAHDTSSSSYSDIMNKQSSSRSMCVIVTRNCIILYYSIGMCICKRVNVYIFLLYICYVLTSLISTFDCMCVCVVHASDQLAAYDDDNLQRFCRIYSGSMTRRSNNNIKLAKYDKCTRIVPTTIVNRSTVSLFNCYHHYIVFFNTYATYARYGFVCVCVCVFASVGNKPCDQLIFFVTTHIASRTDRNKVVVVIVLY